MSYQPYMYNNNRPIGNSNGPRNPRQSQLLMAGNSFQSPQIQTGKFNQSWGKSEDSKNNTKQFNYFSNGNIDVTNSRISTEPSSQNNMGKPLSNSVGTSHQSLNMNFNQQNNQVNNNVYSNVNQANNVGGKQLFKSSIYGSNNNNNNNFQGTNNLLNQKATLNLSGGKPNQVTGGVTPPRKMPRVSQPTISSDINQYMEYMKGFNNNTTADSSPPENSQKEQTSNFNKIRQFMAQSPNRSLTASNINNSNASTQQKFEKKIEQKKPLSINPSTINSMRRSSVDLGNFFHKPLINSSHLKQKKVGVEDFQKIKQLGSGKYGRVFLVRDKACGFICALKCVQKKLLKEQQITEQFIRQLKIQLYLNHPHIIKLYGFFDDSTTIYLIMEVGTGGQLFHQLKKSTSLAQKDVAAIMRQVCDAVRQLHSNRIIHRDIKPQNIVLHDNVIKLCDFGWSVHQDKNLRTTFCGTPLYVCPQILKGKQYDQKIDIWSLGIMMYQMLVGENPFKITKQEQLIKIIKDEVKIPQYVNISKQARDFLDKCLKKNPNDRVTIRELVQHQFFKKYPDKQAQRSKMMGQ